MIRQIIRKELLANLLSLRFLIGLLIAVVMMGVVGFVLSEEYAARRQAYLGDLQRHANDLKQTKVYSVVDVTIDIPPSPLSIFSRGAKDRPSSIAVSAFHVPSILDQNETSGIISVGGTEDRAVNPLLRLFSSIDIAFVITVVFSLLAILLVFDSFSGEKEQGTLRLLLSAPAGRTHLLAGKFIGALVALALPLTLGFLEVVLVGKIAAGIDFTTADWEGLLFLYALSLLFLAAFLALGLFVSLFARESSAALMHLLLVWVIVAVALPASGGYVAEFWAPANSESFQARQVRQAFDEAAGRIPYKQMGGWNGATMTGDGEKILGLTKAEAFNRAEYHRRMVPLQLQLAEDLFRVRDQFRLDLKEKECVRGVFTLLSPCSLFGEISQQAAGTSVITYEQAFASARRYRDALVEYLRPKAASPAWFTRLLDYPDMEPTEENFRYWNAVAAKEGPDVYFTKWWTWDRVAPVDLRDMPQPSVHFPDVGERIFMCLPQVFLLALLATAFLVMAGWKVLRYPA